VAEAIALAVGGRTGRYRVAADVGGCLHQPLGDSPRSLRCSQNVVSSGRHCVAADGADLSG